MAAELPLVLLEPFHCFKNSGPEVIKLFPFSTQLSMKFILLIYVEMPTFVGILTYISMINTTSERLKARNFFICWSFSSLSVEISCSVELSMKKVLQHRGLLCSIVLIRKITTSKTRKVIKHVSLEKRRPQFVLVGLRE